MPYISKNYSLNRSYFIEENAIKSIIKNVATKMDEIKILKHEINIKTKKNIFWVYLVILLNKKENTTFILRKFVKKIESNCSSIFNIKPANILINIKIEEEK